MNFLEWMGIKKVMDDTDPKNVVKFPEKKIPQLVPPTPPKDPDPKIYYRFGVTDNNRISFQMGYSEITMNKQGCQNLINQLTFFMNQLEDDEEE